MSVRSLRRDEAERRAALVTVDAYHLELDLTADPSDASCRARRSTFRAEPGATTFADVRARTVAQRDAQRSSH